MTQLMGNNNKPIAPQKIREGYCAYRRSPGGDGCNGCKFQGRDDLCAKPPRVNPVYQLYKARKTI